MHDGRLGIARRSLSGGIIRLAGVEIPRSTSEVHAMLRHNFAMLRPILSYLFAFVQNSPRVPFFPNFNFIAAVLAISYS
jgi:hypothetical protein